ncbi:S8 family peptidase [Streptomyces sp. NBC_00239]|uniref:S8 family peptidase n=1 Tax=Streptomyces sp. NBC_00239 TaxID=2903640 RepID=UPI002E2B4364|nr:S8 family serine peptidase [Streptomyces sp. NBC_00239]
MSKVRTAALAAAVAASLIAGTAAAAGQPPAAGPAAHQGKKAPAAPAANVTLVTGDRVAVAADGSVVRIDRAKGREGTPFSIRRTPGHTYVIPQDALRLLDEGVLDRRLFEVAGLVAAEYDDARRGTLPLIVSYRRDGAGARVPSAFGEALADSARDRRALPAVDGEAFESPKSGAGGLWSLLVGRTPAGAAARSAAPVTRLWLDGRVRAALDKSVAQIGAPSMWQAGYTGKGVKVAVLDTGVDQTHPDLKGVEIAEKNFSSSPDSKDRHGHGTHVGSTVAGSGAKSGGTYKGVAPGARLLDGKVLGDDGFGSESEIVAGMQWATDQGAQIVNMSIVGGDGPEVDPMETAVAKLSGKALFVIAAGNNGAKPGTITSPGSAPAALTVGAVDKQDRIADFSSRGPTAAGLSKPDLTAPGVDIVAAASTQGGATGGNGYVAMSGTSMATPHVAGAAALLLQQHPGWGGAHLKSLLTGSATPRPELNAHQQGAGRVDLNRARTASVVSEPGSLDFGTQLWPHADDKPVAKTLTYRNQGTTAVTLALTAAGTDAAGRPAPAGMFTVKDAKLTVPAGGTAKTTVTVDTRKGTKDGSFGGTVLASGGGQSVRTGLAVLREIESYDVTVRHLDDAGKPASGYSTQLTKAGSDGQERLAVPYKESGTAVLRLPKGDYQLEGLVMSPGSGNRMAVLVQPVLQVAAKSTVTLDARAAKPFAVTAPDRNAKLVSATVGYYDKNAIVSGSWVFDSTTQFRTAALGPAGGGMQSQLSGVWRSPAAPTTDYRLAFHRTGSWFTGLTRTVALADLAELKFGFGASVSGTTGLVQITASTPDGFSAGPISTMQRALPLSGTQYMSTTGVHWNWTVTQADPQGEARVIYNEGPVSYKPAGRYTLEFNKAVIGPDLAATPDRQGANRYGNTIDANVLLFVDGAGHAGEPVLAGGFTRLESGGRTLAQTGPNEWLTAEVPAASAVYKLTKEATRSTKDTTTSTKVAGVWTFTSAKAPDQGVRLPLSTVRLSPQLTLNGTAKTGSTLKVPLHVAGAAAASGQLAALTVHVSYDDGRTWQPLTVATDAKGARSATVKHPATAGGVSFRVDLKDKQGNTARQTITNAYRLVR